MFSGQFALAGQHSGEQDPVLLYAVETALQLHIAELTEPLRELYVTGYSLPTTSAYIYHSTAKRLQVIFGPYLPEAQPKDFYEMEIASGSMPAEEAKADGAVPRWVEGIEQVSRAAYLFAVTFLVSREPIEPRSVWPLSKRLIARRRRTICST